MACETTFSPLRVAVFEALRCYGTGIYDAPKRLLGNVLDDVDPEARMTHAFEHNCDSVLLRIFADAAHDRTCAAMGTAAHKATLLLTDERMIREDVAKRLACELAFATAGALGIECPETVRAIATQEVRSRLNAPDVERSHGDSSLSSDTASKNAPASVSASVSGASVMRRGGSASTSWLDAQRAHEAARSATASRSVSAYSSMNATVGSSISSHTPHSAHNNVGSSVAPRATASAGSNASVSTHSQLASRVPQSFSTIPSLRLAQAQAAGIGMRWHGFVQAWCVIGAIICAFGGLCYFSLSDFNLNTPLYSAEFWWNVSSAAMFAIAGSYAFAWYRVARFKRGASASFVWPCILSAIATFMHLSVIVAQNSADFTVPIVIAWIQVFMAIVTGGYYSSAKRKALFDL